MNIEYKKNTIIMELNKVIEQTSKEQDELMPEPSAIPKNLEMKIEDILKPEPSKTQNEDEKNLNEQLLNQTIQTCYDLNDKEKDMSKTKTSVNNDNKINEPISRNDEKIVFIKRSNFDDNKPLFIPKTKKKNARMSAQRLQSRNYEAPTSSSNRKLPKQARSKRININKSQDLYEEKSLKLKQKKTPLNPSKQQIREKWLTDSDWMKKMENNHQSQYNHLNLAQRSKQAKKKYSKGVAELEEITKRKGNSGTATPNQHTQELKRNNILLQNYLVDKNKIK